MKILRISHSSGVPAYTERERQLAIRHGMDITLVVPKQWDHLGTEPSAGGEPFQIRRIDTMLTGNVPLFAYDPGQLARIIAEVAPDLVDIHEEPYSVSAFESVLLSQKRAPNAARVVFASQNVYKQYPPPFCFMEQFVYKNVRAAYPCSTEAEQLLRTKGYKNKSTVIGLGFDPTLFAPAPAAKAEIGLSADDFVIGFFGRIERAKGILIAIDALAQLAARSVPAVLVVVGSGADQDLAMEAASQLKVESRLKFLGAKTVSELPQLYSNCDVVVVPSLTTRKWKEQFGRVPVEAMACERPVVVSDSGSLPEVVRDAGLVVRQGDGKALAEALGRLYDDKHARADIAKRGYQRVIGRYTWAHIADEVASLYQAALSS